jgi:hypothetical protein
MGVSQSRVLAALFLCCTTTTALACYTCGGGASGRMTGGGSIICPGSAYRYTFGYELHCKAPGQPISDPNNLEVNLSTGEHFHLTSLSGSTCTGPDASTPTAPFNTMDGTGTGRLNGDPASIRFTLVDKAEPGAGVDIASFTITTSAGNVLQCANTLEGGNNQAHRATGSKP